MTITGNEGIAIGLIISLISLACVVISTFVGIRQNRKANNDANEKRDIEIEKQFVKINVKLDNFCDTTKEMMKNSEKSSDRIEELTKELITCSERIQTLFKYKDDHEERISDLEEKVK